MKGSESNMLESSQCSNKGLDLTLIGPSWIIFFMPEPVTITRGSMPVSSGLKDTCTNRHSRLD